MTAKITLAIGQSNMVQAHTAGVPFPGGWTSDPGIQIWHLSTQEWQTYIPGVNSDANNPSYWGYPAVPCWGPEAEFCRQRRLSFPNDPIWLFKLAYNGTGFFPQPNDRLDWSPRTLTPKVWYSFAIHAVIAKKALPGGAIDDMIVFGGETDAYESMGHLFKYNFHEFDSAVRVLLDCPDMKIVFARIRQFWDPKNYVRDTQVEIGSKPGYAWVDTDDLEARAPNDLGHLSPAATKEVGRRMWAARALL